MEEANNSVIETMEMDGEVVFAREQRYTFPVNQPENKEGSVTLIVMTIPKHSPVDEGYIEILNSLVELGYKEDPMLVCKEMGFHEIPECICPTVRCWENPCPHCNNPNVEKDFEETN